MHAIKIIGTNWRNHKRSLRQIREAVFIEEQGVPQELEWDNLDDNAEHFLAYIGEEVVGCARLIDHKKIGRMAVLKAYRNQYVGREIVDHIKRFASQKRYTLLQLSAQCHAYGFYRRCGFTAYSTPFNDANIPHINMEYRVFSETAQASQYTYSKDQSIYTANRLMEIKGYLHMALSQTRKKMLLSIEDLSHPICKDYDLISKIKYLAKHNRHFKCHILLSHYHPHNNDHELFKLMARLPSFIEIRQHPAASSNVWLFDDTAWLSAEHSHGKACFADSEGIKNHTEKFNQCWHHSKAIQSARQLSI
jgi:predicted GNAT family N-acyltransferase